MHAHLRGAVPPERGKEIDLPPIILKITRGFAWKQTSKDYMASRSAPSELLIALLVVQMPRLAPKNGRRVQLNKKTPY